MALTKRIGAHGRGKGPASRIEDAAFRGQAIATATLGMSRRGVAAVLGVSWSTLCDWVQRGLAHPDEEPYGSFARDYRQAERGIELAASGTKAALIARLYRLVREERWDQIDIPTALRVLTHELESRWPDEYGTSAHRVPDTDMTGEAWIERNGLTQAQLGAMISDPPDPLREALVSNADTVYALLLASGWSPRAMAAE